MPGKNAGSNSSWGAREVVLGTLTIAAVSALVWVLLRWHDVVFLLFVAIVISTAIKPAVENLQRLGIPRPAGIIIVYVLGITLLVVMLIVAAPLVGEQVARITSAIPGVYRDLRDNMLQTSNLFTWRLGLALPDQFPLMTGSPEASDDSVPGVRDAINMVSPVAQALFGILVTFVLAFYWTVEGERIKHAAFMTLSMERRENARELIATLEAQLGRYIVGQGLLMASIAVISLVGYLVMGLPYALVLALFAGLMEAVPLIGPGLGAIPAAAIAYSISPNLAIWVIVFTLVLQQIENNVLVPRIMRRSVGVHPLVTLLALTALGTFFGVIGAIVAVPLAAILQLLFFRYVVERQHGGTETLEGRDLFSVIRYEAQELLKDLRRQVRSGGEDEDPSAAAEEEHSPIVDELEAIAAELSTLLVESRNGEIANAEEPSPEALP